MKREKQQQQTKTQKRKNASKKKKKKKKKTEENQKCYRFRCQRQANCNCRQETLRYVCNDDTDGKDDVTNCLSAENEPENEERHSNRDCNYRN